MALLLRPRGRRGPTRHVCGEKRDRLAREAALEGRHPWAVGSHGKFTGGGRGDMTRSGEGAQSRRKVAPHSGGYRFRLRGSFCASRISIQKILESLSFKPLVPHGLRWPR